MKWHYNAPSRKGRKPKTGKMKTFNNNNIITLDTETTSLQMPDGENAAIMYIWMLHINGLTIYGRDYAGLRECLETINDEKAVNVIYVHNLGFDFHFLRNALDFEHVFARTANKPIFARYKNIEFRCSYMLSNMSLDTLCKEYKLNVQKMTGDLDYSLTRHSGTLLTAQELQYCAHDVEALAEYVKYQLKQCGGNYKHIPYTQTGFVRQFILDYCKENKLYYDLRSTVQRIRPDAEIFRFLENAYAGGYTHANYMAVAAAEFNDVHSFDITSSYPAVMYRKRFPMTKFKEVTQNKTWYLQSADYACLFYIRLEGVQAKSDLCYISKHKTYKTENAVINNGRLYSADVIEMYITDIDYYSIMKMYNVQHKYIGRMYVSHYGYLPKAIVQCVIDLYKNKTQYKGIDEKYAIYLASKQMVNSVYGMCVMNPCGDLVQFENDSWQPLIKTVTDYDETGEEIQRPKTRDELLQEYYDGRNVLNVYQWGVWITAHARRELVEMCTRIADTTPGFCNVLYMDTDSIKYTGDYKQLFWQRNDEIHAENVAAAAHYGHTAADYAPLDVKDVPHELGLWDYEGQYSHFKTMGAKRYCYIKDNKLHPVVAGCPVKSMQAYAAAQGVENLDWFMLDIEIDADHAGKLAMTYTPKYDKYVEVTDYTGSTQLQWVGYGVHAKAVGFNMSLHDDYYKFLLGYAISDRAAMVRNKILKDTARKFK